MSTAELVSTDVILDLFHLRVFSKIDRRIVACSVAAERTESGFVVRGFSMFPQTDAFIRSTAEKTFAPEAVQFDLQVLTRDYPLAFHEVRASAAPFFKETQVTKDDMLTEALYGAVVRTFFERDGFILAQHMDGYIGYVPADTLQPSDSSRYLRWKNGDYAVLQEPVAIAQPGTEGKLFLAPATRLTLNEDGTLELLSGERLSLTPEQYQAHRRNPAAYAAALERHAANFRDTPYLWGGKTQAGIDCSGFMQTLMLQEGIALPRDASMQAYVGEIVGYLPNYEDLLPGDLVFFMNNTGHVFHVGVYLGERMYLHSSGLQNIIRSSFDPNGKNYAERYGGTFVFGRRLRP